ncbi:HvfC family RiPP maturation protein [Paraglaciecola aestuariivivens]
MKSFKTIQHAFMQHLKDPDNQEFTLGVEDRRLKIYRELFFNNVMGFLDSGFPVLKSIYSQDEWLRLGREFFSKHQCRSPFFVDISKEFVEFLSNSYELKAADPVFLAQLAHYEWLELDVSIRQSDQQQRPWQPEQGIEWVQFSELASLVSYEYPVHQISQEFQPSQPSEPIYLVVYRDAEDAVQFSLLNAVSAFLLNSIIQNGKMNLMQLNDLMAESMPQLSPKQLQDSIKEVLQQLLEQQVLIAGA